MCSERRGTDRIEPRGAAGSESDASDFEGDCRVPTLSGGIRQLGRQAAPYEYGFSRVTRVKLAERSLL
jgi:hypothetical protein